MKWEHPPDVGGIHCCLMWQVQNHLPWDDQTCNWNQIYRCHSLHSTENNKNVRNQSFHHMTIKNNIFWPKISIRNSFRIGLITSQSGCPGRSGYSTIPAVFPTPLTWKTQQNFTDTCLNQKQAKIFSEYPTSLYIRLQSHIHSGVTYKVLAPIGTSTCLLKVLAPTRDSNLPLVVDIWRLVIIYSLHSKL